MALPNMDVDFIHCRDWGHSWTAFTASYDRKTRLYEQQLKCTRCDTIRIREISQTGGRYSSSYRYPDGYLLPAGFGGLTSEDRDEIRLRSITASMEGKPFRVVRRSA